MFDVVIRIDSSVLMSTLNIFIEDRIDNTELSLSLDPDQKPHSMESLDKHCLTMPIL